MSTRSWASAHQAQSTSSSVDTLIPKYVAPPRAPSAGSVFVLPRGFTCGSLCCWHRQVCLDLFDSLQNVRCFEHQYFSSSWFVHGHWLVPRLRCVSQVSEQQLNDAIAQAVENSKLRRDRSQWSIDGECVFVFYQMNWSWSCFCLQNFSLMEAFFPLYLFKLTLSHSSYLVHSFRAIT